MRHKRKAWADRIGAALASTLRWVLAQDEPVKATKGKRKGPSPWRPACYMDGTPSSTLYRIR